ncbi:hypothetical protein [Agarivorans sp. Z349TD_8]|uniref:hypothetical protein n=1 Tax=Agarivorans sp. Z349TD_8 TaxID=3421434 RepID=UPI003D7E1540
MVEFISDFEEQLAKAKELLVLLRAALDEDKVDLQLVQALTQQHSTLLSSIFELVTNSNFSTSEKIQQINTHLKSMSMLYDYCEQRRSDINSKLGSLKQGKKVINAYFQNI